MSPPGDPSGPELPPPPLRDEEALLAAQPARFPDAPLPWAVVAAGVVQGVAQPGQWLLMQRLWAALESAQGRPVTAAPSPSGMASLGASYAVAAVLFASGLAASDRLLPRWPRPLRWAMAGATGSAIATGILLAVNWGAAGLPLLSGPALVEVVVWVGAWEAGVALVAGVVYAVAAWRARNPVAAFAVAGAMASVLSVLATMLHSVLVARRYGQGSPVPLWAAEWHLMVLSQFLLVVVGAASGACFGYLIVWAEGRRLAREHRAAEATR